MDMDDFSEKTKLIDKILDSVISGKIPNLHDAIKYHMETGGKRVRPLLAIMTCEALGGSEEQVLPFAAACELMHNWFLVHDDIEDGDTVRRDKPTVWVKYGIPHAVNIGDYMAHKVFELILKCKDYGVSDSTISKIFEETVKTALETAEGQAMDMNMRNNDNPTEKEYIETIKRKTARYLTMSIVGGAIIAGRVDMTEKLVEFGMQLGLAFQISDDLLDMTEGKGRGEIGRDIKEGKRSLLVVHCLSKCQKDERERLLHILNKSVNETTHDDVLYAKSLFEKYESIDYARKKAEEFSQQAKKIADSMPAKLREVLHFFADYIVKRNK